MGCNCKGHCRFEQKANRWTYTNGKKMCTTCEKSIDTTDLRCYCCKHVFRIGAQENKYRQKRVADAVRL